MYHLRNDTLAGLKTSALFLPRRLWGQPLSLAISSLNAYMHENSKNASPEAEAFKFYYANHVFSLIANQYELHEPLPGAVCDLARGYVKLSSDLVVRLAYYCLLICTREVRHLHGNSAIYSALMEEWGQPVSDFLKAGHGGEEGAVAKLRNDPPDTSLGNFVGGLAMAFHDGNWSGGYGGPAWGKVADTLYKVVVGDTTPEMFADTAFTLAHNNGPIFNKGMLYTGYSHFIYKLLDVQRSGQVPQLFLDDSTGHLNLDSATKSFIADALITFPEELGGYVDWFKVEALGALRHYGSEKSAQVAAHGHSTYMSELEAKEGKKFWITPTEHVLVVEREKEAA